MALYFFNVRIGQTTWVDVDGIDLPDHDSVVHETLAGARDLITEQLRAGGKLRRRTVFEVANEGGGVVHRLSFRDMMTDS